MSTTLGIIGRAKQLSRVNNSSKWHYSYYYGKYDIGFQYVDGSVICSDDTTIELLGTTQEKPFPYSPSDFAYRRKVFCV